MGDPIISLESIQAALGEEVQKFEAIRKASTSLSDSYRTETTSAEDSPLCNAKISDNLFRELHFDGKETNGYPLDCEVHSLRSKLEDVSARFKVKESEINELETALTGSGGVLREPSVSASQSLEEKCREMEIELEDLYKQKIEFEVEHLIVLKMSQRLSLTEDDQISLFEEQKSLAAKQIQMMHKLKEAEHKAAAVKNHAEELASTCKQLLATEEVLRMQNRLYEYTLYFTVQIILLLIMFMIFILRPRTNEVVPT